MKREWISISRDTKRTLAEIADEQETDVNSLAEELLRTFVEGYDGEQEEDCETDSDEESEEDD